MLINISLNLTTENKPDHALKKTEKSLKKRDFFPKYQTKSKKISVEN